MKYPVCRFRGIAACRHRLGIAVFVLALACPAIVQAKDDPSDETPVPEAITWVHDLKEAVKRAAESDRHIVAEFYTDWCKWCKIMADSTFSDPQVIAMAQRYVFARINAELDTAAATRFSISGYPTVILLDKAGNEVDRIMGYTRPVDFVTTIDKYLKGDGTLWELEKENRDKPNNPATMYAIGVKYMGRGNVEKARQFLQNVIRKDKSNSSGWTDDAQFKLAVLERRERNWYKAIEGFRKLMKQYPDSELREDAEIYIGWLYTQAGDNKEAVKKYRQFLEDFSKSPERNWVKEQIKLLEEPVKDTTSEG